MVREVQEQRSLSNSQHNHHASTPSLHHIRFHHDCSLSHSRLSEVSSYSSMLFPRHCSYLLFAQILLFFLIEDVSATPLRRRGMPPTNMAEEIVSAPIEEVRRAFETFYSPASLDESGRHETSLERTLRQSNQEGAARRQVELNLSANNHRRVREPAGKSFSA